MTRHWTPLAIVWLALAIIALVLSTLFNALTVIQARDFIADWMGSGPAVSSLTADILVAAIAGAIFIVAESRRLGMRHGWAYLVLSCVTAFAVGFPLFLAMRERQLEAARGDAAKRELDV